MAHMGVKGTVADAETGKAISNAVIHTKNVTRLGTGQRRSDDIDHDVTSVHDGDYWRLLTPGEYEISVSAEGYAPAAKLIEVTMNHDDHKAAPILDFELNQLTPAQLAEQNSDFSNGDILLDGGQFLSGLNDVEPDEHLMDSPSDWTSISEQYLPHQDTINIEDDEENDVNKRESNLMPDYLYDYAEVPPNYATQDNLDDAYY